MMGRQEDVVMENFETIAVGGTDTIGRSGTGRTMVEMLVLLTNGSFPGMTTVRFGFALFSGNEVSIEGR